MEYVILSKKTSPDLTYEVRRYIEIGWKLQGGVSMAVGEHNLVMFAQAMVKDEVKVSDQIAISLARAQYFATRIAAKSYVGRTVHKGAYDGPLMTEEELLQDEVDTMNRHIQHAQKLLDGEN